MKKYLDELVRKYETKEFIKSDPIKFAHRFKEKKDIEIAAFISSLFAFGKREAFISKLEDIFLKMENEPYNFICDFKREDKIFSGFVYRFIKEEDLAELLYCLSNLYKKDKSSLGELFYNGYLEKSTLNVATKYFYKCAIKNNSLGFCHLFAKPENNGAMKRLNMFLRWLVRDGAVDLGLWDFMKKSELFIPLDVHVSKVSRSLGLLQRKANDFKSVIELTEKLKEFDPRDPVKYDFALFGAGVDKKI